MKKIIVLFALALMACSSNDGLTYFVPQLEKIDGGLPQMTAFPMKSMADCQEMQKVFAEDMQNSPDVLSSASVCLPSSMVVKPATVAAGITKSSEGTI